jgi:serine/threonine protein kinase
MDAHLLALHPTDQTLSSYGLGKLDDSSAEAVNQHLEQCPDCRKRVAEMSADSFLGRLRGAQGSPVMSATNRSQLGESSAERGSPASPPPPADTLPLALADHPDYDVIRELGRGGMGVVYLVRNKLMGRLEVLKVVSGHLVERPGVRDRFLREVQSAAKLQHKNIVTAYSAIRLGESIALAMEYVPGDDLAKVVKSGGPLPVINACYFIYQAALGLQHAHERGMVHRDIKPANLIVARESKKAIVKVLDFGLAKVTSEGQTDNGLTREGQMLGTPEYIAPEQIRNAQSADIRADIYSLGCTFYYLLTGGPPFHGEHLWDLYQAHFSMNAETLNLVRPDVPVDLAALVAKMMAKEPARRFQTPGEVARELTRFFKPANSQPAASSAEMSRINPPSTPTQTSGVGQAASSPQLVVGRSAAAQPATGETSPAPAPRVPSKPKPEGVTWESLIEFKETEHSIAAPKPKSEVTPISAPVRRPPWVLASVATGVLTIGLCTAWLGVMFEVKTPDGVIVLENLPNDSEKLAPPLIVEQKPKPSVPRAPNPPVTLKPAPPLIVEQSQADPRGVGSDSATASVTARTKTAKDIDGPSDPANVKPQGKRADLEGGITSHSEIGPGGQGIPGNAARQGAADTSDARAHEPKPTAEPNKARTQDLIATTLEKERSKYQKTVKVLLDDAQKTAKKNKNSILLSRIQEEQQAFASEGEIPTVLSRSPLAQRRSRDAVKAMIRAFRRAIEEYIKDGKKEDADRVKQQLHRLERDSIALDGWKRLLQGGSLRGWIVDPPDAHAWRIEGDELVRISDNWCWLLSERSYSDFILGFEFQLPGDGDSGVTILAERAEPKLEIQLRTDQAVSLVEVAWGQLPSLDPQGAWNRMQVRLLNNSLRVTINEKGVLETNLLAHDDKRLKFPGLKRGSGRIGFQGMIGKVRFRNILLNEFISGDANGVAFPATGAWLHGSWTIVLREDGAITDANGGPVAGTWEQTGSNLTLRWPNANTV